MTEEAAAFELLEELTTPRPIAEYHEDMGTVLWWCWEVPACGRCDGAGTSYDNVRAETFACPVCHGKAPDPRDGGWKGEPPYVGSPLDLGITVEVHTRSRIISQLDQEHSPTTHIERRTLGGWPGYHTHFTPLPPMPKVPR